MDFSSMGRLTAQTEIEKGSIHTSDEVKNATIRVGENYLELLNIISGQLGLSRQAFMSKLVENYATEAVAEYYMGYTSDYIDVPLEKLFSDATTDEAMQERLKRFLKEVKRKEIWFRASNRGIFLMPLEEETKLRYKHMEREQLVELHGENISFPADLPPLPEEQK